MKEGVWFFGFQDLGFHGSWICGVAPVLEVRKIDGEKVVRKEGPITGIATILLGTESPVDSSKD